jgi:hypothetical protein
MLFLLRTTKKEPGGGRVENAQSALIWRALPDGNADFLNQRSRDYTGINPDEGVGDHDLRSVIDAISMTAWSAMCQ